MRPSRAGAVVVAAALAWGTLATGVGAAPADVPRFPTARLAGGDRYETAAAIASVFPRGPLLAFVATGEDFADALAAAPAAAQVHAPLLLVTRNTIPSAIATTLDRLDPGNIIVVGGSLAIADEVINQLRAYTAGEVVRVAGRTRYGTALAISRRFDAPPVAFLANANAFPDALAAGAAAGALHGPLLLVDQGQLPDGTAGELARLAARRLVIAGGTSVVGEAVRDQLAPFSPDLTRLAGGDRYATAAAISAASFAPGVPAVYLTTGESFPDALAGGALAGGTGAPLLLSRPDCIPPVVMAEIDRLAPPGVILLGGERALSAAVASLTVCGGPLAPPPPPPPVVQPVGVTFGDGVHRVGVDIPPGTYQIDGGSTLCHWERQGASAVIGRRISRGAQVVTVAPSDVTLMTYDCGIWTSDLQPPVPLFGDGTWIYNPSPSPVDLVSDGGAHCQFEILTGFGGTFAEVASINAGPGPARITFYPHHRGFFTSGCATWRPVSRL